MFNLEEFVANPSVGALTALQKKDWASLAIYYELEPRPTLIKTQLQKLVLEHFIEEEVLDRNEVQDHFSLGSGDTEEARLSLERERVKLEILREQNKAKELSYLSHSDKYLPCFDEGQPETFFSQFEKNAAIHRWPPGTWAVLLSNVFTGEAQRAYAGLSVDESLDYATVKSTILRVYKRVPAYYRKIFRTSQKRANQTCVEFYREKLAQCHRWVDSAQVENNYQKLLELIANKLPLTQSSLKLNPNPSGPREPAALSPLQGRPRFAPMNSGSVSPDDSLQPSHSVTILRDSGSVRTFVLREAISSFPQCQTGHSLVVRGLFSKDQEPSEVSPACVVTRSNSRRLVKDSLSVPQVANPPPENNIVSYSPNPKFSLDEFFNSASQESNVLDQTSSSEPVMRSITDMAVT
ncbi:hypothetical protein Pcinc_005865 [Petrolisthes cinctipes]|uniref:SCAN box domain-containing protein n=1 Tax=Petrolisthes cinctipes TaxID=88211 RepID=A0AAE1GBS9_PETCI|nr:hypothetical protein Pcinc_005865 [Petrolisthes cinctipes]